METKMQIGNMLHKLYQDPIGLRVLKDVVIRCKNCNAPLANILLAETNEDRVSRNLKPLKTKYKVINCYKCKDGSSFQSEVFEGSTSIAPNEGFALDEQDIELLEDGVLFSTLKVRKENV